MGFPGFGENSPESHSSKFTKGVKLYDEGWALEVKKYFGKSNSKTPPIPLCDVADSKFDQAHSLFKGAVKEDGGKCEESTKYLGMTSLKLKGNSKLRSSLICERQAMSAFTDGNHRHGFIRWKDALDDLLVAKQSFQDGLEMAGSTDKRFLDSVKFVESQLEKLMEEKRKVEEKREEIQEKFGIERDLEKQVHGEILKQLEEERRREGLLKENVMKIHEILTPAQPVLPILYALRLLDNIEL